MEQNAELILIVEDEPKLAQLLTDYLHAAHYRTHWLARGGEVTAWVQENKPDLILLDLMLPEKDGLTLCREIRQFSDVPVMMVTAKTEEIDRLLGLEIGADDYVCKPYSPREVVARIKTILRRCQRSNDTSEDKCDTLTIDEVNYQVRFGTQSRISLRLNSACCAPWCHSRALCCHAISCWIICMMITAWSLTARLTAISKSAPQARAVRR